MTSLAMALWRLNAVAATSVKAQVHTWIKDIDTMARDLTEERIATIDSQLRLERLLRLVDLDDLIAFIDFDRLTSGLKLPSLGETNVVIDLGDRRFKAEITAMDRGRSIPPHGHNNQMTEFVVLKGDLHARHFEREDNGLDKILTPTIDQTFHRGSISTISDDKDNVHWFTALTGPAFMFNVVVSNLATRPGAGVGRVKLDLRGGAMPDGRIRAKGIDLETWLKVYG
jgi:hypothetical protein